MLSFQSYSPVIPQHRMTSQTPMRFAAAKATAEMTNPTFNQTALLRERHGDLSELSLKEIVSRMLAIEELAAQASGRMGKGGFDILPWDKEDLKKLGVSNGYLKALEELKFKLL